MVLELAGHAAFNGPMPGIVDPGSHLIGNQTAPDHEEFDGENTDILERIHHPLQIQAGAALELRIPERRNAVMQDAAAVSIRRQRIELGVARRGARADDGQLARKFLKFLVDQSGAADRRPGLVDLTQVAQYELALAVITQAPRLEHAGKSELADRADQL